MVQKCFVVCSHEHDGFHVCEVFSSYEDAKDYSDQMRNCVPFSVVDEFRIILSRFNGGSDAK